MKKKNDAKKRGAGLKAVHPVPASMPVTVPTRTGVSGPPAGPENAGIAAALVHEIKNPLAAIHMHLQLLEGYVQEISEDDLRGKIERKVSVLKREILGLNRTLQEFLRLLRPEPATEKDVRVDLNGMIGEIVEFVEPQALREGIDIKFAPGPVGEPRNFDQVFLKQVVLNLVINAIQAFQGSEVRLDDRKIVVSTGRRDSVLFVSVADNGPGIPGEEQDRIFEPFFSTKKDGTGLGLTLVKKMIAEMGGRVEVRSELGKGTEFIVYLGVMHALDPHHRRRRLAEERS